MYITTIRYGINIFFFLYTNVTIRNSIPNTNNLYITPNVIFILLWIFIPVTKSINGLSNINILIMLDMLFFI